MEKSGRFDLNLFEVFAAVLREGSITRAAVALNLSQPAVSHALGRLRDLLKDPIFVREGHTMVPTPLARRLIEPVHTGLHALDGALAQLRSFDPLKSDRRFTLGLRHTIEPAVLPLIVERLRTDAHGISIASVHHDREQIERSLASGELDIAIDVRMPTPPTIAFRRLMGGSYLVAARKGHPALTNGLDLKGYVELDHVLASSRRGGFNIEDVALQEIGKTRRIVVRCQNHWTASQVAARSDILFTVPERFAPVLCRSDQHELHSFPAPLADVHIFLYWHVKSDLDPPNMWLRDRIISTIGS